MYLYMYEYLHHRLNTSVSKSVLMEERAALVFVHDWCVHITPGLEAFAVPGPSTPQLGAFVPSPATPKLPVTANLAYLGSFCLGCRMVILLKTRART